MQLSRVRIRRPATRRGWIFIGLAALVVVGWLVSCYLVIIHPKVSKPAPADAIVVLGPGSIDGRVQTALNLAREGLAPVLLISQPSNNQSVREVCQGPRPPGVEIICFDPSPRTTRGEAREIRAQADARGWQRIMVVTSTYHISRARMIVQRCYSGQLLMVPARNPGVLDWAYNLIYQPAAYVKAALLSGC